MPSSRRRKARPVKSLSLVTRQKLSILPEYSKSMASIAWDYCYRGGAIRYDDTWKAAIPLMKEYMMNVPVMGGPGIPWPRPNQIDATGAITAELDWSRLDDWISRWGCTHGASTW